MVAKLRTLFCIGFGVLILVSGLVAGRAIDTHDEIPEVVATRDVGLAEYASPGNRHKVVVTNSLAAESLEARGARRIAAYGSETLLEVIADGAALALLRQEASLRDHYNLIRLNSGPLDTSTTEALAMSRLASEAQGSRLYLIQFAGPIKSEWFNRLTRTGVEVVSYIPANAYLVHGDDSSLARLERFASRSGSVQWTGEYRAELKIDPAVEPTEKQARTLSLAGIDFVDDLFAIQLFKNEQTNAQTLALLEQVATEPFKNRFEILNYINVVVRTSVDSIKLVASRPDVVSIQRYIEPTLFDERQAQIMAANLVGGVPNSVPSYLAFLAQLGFTQPQFDLSGFVVDVADGGLDNGTTAPNHFGLYVAGSRPGTSRVAYVKQEGTASASDRSGCGPGHGTWVTHILAGFTANQPPGFPHSQVFGQGSFYDGTGLNPFVRVGNSVFFTVNNQFTQPNFADSMSRSYNQGARLSNNSWGAAVAGSYDINSQAYDALVRDSQPQGGAVPATGNQEMVVVFAAGNSGPNLGTVGSPGTAKNVITVGGSQNYRQDFSDTLSAENMYISSSRGPCIDGRKKPDLVAPATKIAGGVIQVASPPSTGQADSCYSGGFYPAGAQWYTVGNGTSFASPAVAGAASLLRQFFINKGLDPPSPAMTKAWLMNTASRITGTGANDSLWSNNQGMGRVNLARAFEPSGGEGPERIIKDQLGERVFTATGQQHFITGDIVDADRPFRVTLAWTDAPGSTAGAAFNNDLDLEVWLGDQVYKGNHFSADTSIPGGAKDFRNNVESVFLPPGVTGPFAIRVRAAHINSDGVPNFGGPLDQDYALVVYNAVEVERPVMSGAGSAIVAESCSPGNGVVDPGEQLSVTLGVQNVGTFGAGNVVGTLLAGGGVTNPSEPQNYGSIPPGGLPVARTFSFRASPFLSCGDTISLTLQLQDGTSNLGTLVFNFMVGSPSETVVYGESFDGVQAPLLPAGWVAAVAEGSSENNWRTSATIADTPPNSLFVPNPSTVHDVRVESPLIAIATPNAVLRFRNNYDTESSFDGGVLEVSIAGGAFQDILAAGGTFVSGGYNVVLSPHFLNPLGGREAWSGDSGGFVSTIVNLPPSAGGQTIRLRWRFGSDITVASNGWRVDSISITDGIECCVPACSISCPANIVVISQPGQCTVPIIYPPPGATGGDCGPIQCSPPSGASFPIGVTTVHCQSEAGAACSFTVTVNNGGPPYVIAPMQLDVSFSGGPNSVTLTTTNSCPWSIINTEGWINVTSPASGIGNATIGFTIGINYGPPRSGSITIGDQTLIVNQGGDTDGDGIPDEIELIEGTNPFVKDNDIFTNAQFFVKQQYRDFLSREGDPGGVAFWTDLILAGSLTRSQVILNFFDSAEFQNTTAPVTRLYFAYFLRIPDTAGLLFWTNQFRQGSTLEAISETFAQSPEFVMRYGNLNNLEFVTLVYNNVLDRAPDPGGLAFWTAQLDSGSLTRGQVMLGFSESAEYRDVTRHKVFVTQIYVGMLRRAPDQQGFEFWVAHIEGGAPRLDLVQGFLDSIEYRNRFLPPL